MPRRTKNLPIPVNYRFRSWQRTKSGIVCPWQEQCRFERERRRFCRAWPAIRNRPKFPSTRRLERPITSLSQAPRTRAGDNRTRQRYNLRQAFRLRDQLFRDGQGHPTASAEARQASPLSQRLHPSQSAEGLTPGMASVARRDGSHCRFLALGCGPARGGKFEIRSTKDQTRTKHEKKE
jgi:hypothetical protein